MQGLLHECCIILTLLQDDDPTRIVIPASVRSGDGEYNPTGTHDLALLTLGEGCIESCTPIEAKVTRRMQHRERYTALIVSRNDLLPVTSGKNEGDLVRAYIATYGKCATPNQLSMIEQATNRLRHRVDEYMYDREHESQVGHDTSRQPLVHCCGVLGKIAAMGAVS